MQVFENLNYRYVDTGSNRMSLLRIKFKREKLYWICQVLGWGIIVTLNFIVIASQGEMQNRQLVTSLVLIITGIGFTHYYRRIIKKKNWLELPLKKIIPRVIISSLIIGSIIYGFIYAAGYLAGILEADDKNITSVVISVINLSGISLFWSLIYFSIHYLENYKKSEIESLIWEAAVKDYELKTLKSQLNPHFMFNAMNSIRSLIEEEPESAKIALTKLSSILRYSLRMERAESVPLGEEIKSVKDYLDLEKMRFEERLKYRLDVSEESERIEIPPMMIQTLVENGIKHGISKITAGGTIKVKSIIQNSDLLISIENDGHLDDDALKNSRGFGIANTKHRLNLLFGEKASFTLTNNPENKVVAKLRIPVEGVHS